MVKQVVEDHEAIIRTVRGDIQACLIEYADAGTGEFLVFEQGLGAAETLLRLEYNLTRRVSLRLQAGEPSGGGIFYRRRWD
jgi:hypothetical protein